MALAIKSARVAGVAKAPARSSRVAVVRCQASLSKDVKKAVAFAAGLPALVAASPAFALVDERLNGDGTGRPLGINDPILGFVFIGVAGLIWSLYFNSQKDFGDFEDDDAGLKL